MRIHLLKLLWWSWSERDNKVMLFLMLVINKWNRKGIYSFRIRTTVVAAEPAKPPQTHDTCPSVPWGQESEYWCWLHGHWSWCKRRVKLAWAATLRMKAPVTVWYVRQVRPTSFSDDLIFIWIQWKLIKTTHYRLLLSRPGHQQQDGMRGTQLQYGWLDSLHDLPDRLRLLLTQSGPLCVHLGYNPKWNPTLVWSVPHWLALPISEYHKPDHTDP